ncbi:MAG: DUF1549 domain-containing protein [Pirellulales bacterium]
MPRFIPSFWTLSCLLSCVLFATTARADDTLEYNRDVRPILAEGCFACHGPDSVARQADLRLDQREAAIEMGAITPGEVDDSEMIRRIYSDDEAEVMPPPTAHNQLKPEQKEVLRQWVAQGAEYQPHWSFIPPTRPELPTVQNTAWPRNEIDYFVLARMEAAGLAPNEAADRWTLARRASLDITGLPPDAEVVEAFVADESPDAYEKLIDTLLASPRWGEHRGRYWLDYARYADTHGAHFDNFREMWSYRDWVIKAHNANMPFDEFTIENLAGDLLPDRTLDQQIASGFNRCNLTTNEGGIIDEEYLVLYTRDRTETTSHVWLGITANCAVCHDHKFDPLSQREFYEMSAFFNNTTQGARDGNIKDTPPIVVVPTAEDRDRWAELKTAVPAASAELEARRGEARGEFDAWLAAATPAYFQSKLPTGDLVLHAPLDEGTGDVTRMSIDGQVRKVALRETAHWLPGHVGTQAVELTQGAACELADVGDFDGSKPFSCGAGCACRPTTAAARSWHAWTTTTTTAAGISGSKDARRHAHHPPLAGRRPQGRFQGPGAGHRVDARAGDLRRFAKGGRCEGLYQRQRTTDQRAGRSVEKHGPHGRAVEDRPAEHGQPALGNRCAGRAAVSAHAPAKRSAEPCPVDALRRDRGHGRRSARRQGR